MTDRPILFSAPMVRALLDGRKTQTRRIVKPQPVSTGHRPLISYNHGVAEISFGPDDQDKRGLRWWRSPYGQPGDRLWVREAWSPSDAPGGVAYRSDLDPRQDPRGMGWKPSIHMPRRASRLTLTITDVRVQRLQEISEGDARAEGVEPPATEREDHDWSICPQCGGTGLHGALGPNLGVMEVDCIDCDTYAKRFKHLWQHINGPASWDANPWVWALSFEVTKANIDRGAA